MSSWGNNDNAANAPYWAVNASINKNNAAYAQSTAANVALLYGNTTPDMYITGETIGLFAVDAQEEAVAETGAHPCHTGWVYRTTGSGGRAGRVTHEVLACLNNIISDGDGQVYANVSIALSGPANGSAVHGVGNTVSFSVTPTLTGNTNATLTYSWQFYNGSTWGSTSANAIFTGNTSSTLVANATTTQANSWLVRAIVTAADEGVSVTSANAVITVS